MLIKFLFRLFTLIFLYHFLFCIGYANTANQNKKITQIVNKIKTKNDLTGVIIGVWENSKPIAVLALGNSMTQVPATTDMHIRIGGIAETFLTTLLLKLVDQNALNLHDTIHTWYPNYPNAQEVTLEMLARGMSGYPDYVYDQEFLKENIKNPFKAWSSQELLNYAFNKQPLFKPGTNQQYSHTDYIILGDIIQKVMNKSISELIFSELIEPTGLKGTHFNLTATMPQPILHAYSKDRNVFEDATFWNPSWTSNTGSMTSTLADLNKWAKTFGKGELITKNSFNELIKGTTIGFGQNTNSRYFAMGFGVLNKWLVQNPRFNGYSGFFAYHPDTNVSVIIFSTIGEQTDDSQNYSMTIATEIIEYLYPQNKLPKLSY